MNVELEFHEKQCARCGKEFIGNLDWAYKIGKRYNAIMFCSWSCLRAYEKERGSKIDRREKIINALRRGKQVDEIAKELHVDRTNVVYWQKKLEAV